MAGLGPGSRGTRIPTWGWIWQSLRRNPGIRLAWNPRPPPCAWPAPRGWGHPRLLGYPFYCAPRPDRSAPLHFPVDEIHCGTLHHLVDRRFRDTTDDPVRIRQPADIRGRTACASARPIPCPTPVVRICTLPRVSCTAICNATVRVDEFLATDRRSGCHWFIVHMVPFSACRCSHESFICSGL